MLVREDDIWVDVSRKPSGAGLLTVLTGIDPLLE